MSKPAAAKAFRLPQWITRRHKFILRSWSTIENRLFFTIITLRNRYKAAPDNSVDDVDARLLKYLFKTFGEGLALVLTSQDKADDELTAEYERLVNRGGGFEGLLEIPEVAQNAQKTSELAEEQTVAPEPDGAAGIELSILSAPTAPLESTAPPEATPTLEAELVPEPDRVNQHEVRHRIVK
jgi:hypothetical protein